MLYIWNSQADLFLIVFYIHVALSIKKELRSQRILSLIFRIKPGFEIIKSYKVPFEEWRQIAEDVPKHNLYNLISEVEPAEMQ